MKKLFYTLFLPFLLCSCSSLFDAGHAQVELNVNSIARQTGFDSYIIECSLFSENEEFHKNSSEKFYKSVSISKDDIDSQKNTSFKFAGIPMGISLQAMVFISGQVDSERTIFLYSGESQPVTVDSTKIRLNVELTPCYGEAAGAVNEIPDLTIDCEKLEQTEDQNADIVPYPEFTVSKDNHTLEFNAVFNTDQSVSDSAVYEWILNGNILDEKSDSFTLDCLTNEYVNCSKEGELNLNTLVVVVTDGTQSKSAQIQFVLNYVEGQ